MCASNNRQEEIKLQFDPRAIFPLRLSAFEEYMHIDSRPELPMTESVVWIFEGKVDEGALRRALERALSYEPLAFARIVKRRGHFYWVLPERLESPQLRVSQTAATIAKLQSGVVPLSIFYPSKESSIRFELIVAPDGFIVRTPTYHSLTDGGGLCRFVGGWFAFYEDELRRSGALSLDSNDSLEGWEPPLPETIGDREDFHYVPPKKEARTKNLKPLLNKVVHFLTTRPWNLAPACWNAKQLRRKKREEIAKTTVQDPRKGRNSSEDPSIASLPFFVNRPLTPGGEEDAVSNRPRVYWQTLPNEVLERVKRRAKSAGVSVNTQMTRDLWVGLEKWRSSIEPKQKKRNWRIMEPINVRNEGHARLPLSNVVGYIFLDRSTKEIDEPEEKFLRDFDKQMSDIIKWSTGLYFIYGLRFFEKIPGALKMMTSKAFCYATLCFSNVGPIWRQFAQPKFREAKTIEIKGELKLLKMIGAPSVRPNLPIGIGFTTAVDTILSFCIDDSVVAATEREMMIASILSEISREN